MCESSFYLEYSFTLLHHPPPGTEYSNSSARFCHYSYKKTTYLCALNYQCREIKCKAPKRIYYVNPARMETCMQDMQSYITKLILIRRCVYSPNKKEILNYLIIEYKQESESRVKAE